MKKKEFEFDPLFTRRESWEEVTVEKPVDCRMCRRQRYTGEIVLKKINPQTKEIGKTVLCNDDCLLEYDNLIWQKKARANQGGFRTSITEAVVTFEFGNTPDNNKHHLKYKEIKI